MPRSWRELHQCYLRSINNYNTGSYLYNGNGERTLAVRNNQTVTDYAYLNGQPMASYEAVTNTWTDYIYANGQKIAKAVSQRTLLHISGIRYDNNFSCGVEGGVSGVPAGISGHTVQSGDRLSVYMQQTQNHPTYGGLALIFTDGTGSGDLQDSTGDHSGYLYSNAQADGAWHRFVGDLTPYAGKTISYVLAGIHQNTPTGNFDLAYADAAIQTADGQTLTVLDGNQSVPAFHDWTCGGNNMNGTSSATGVSGSPVSTNYYLADHLGSTQMELSAGGWPVWQGQFTPFGQEIVAGNTLLPTSRDGSSNPFKFTGKERDTESGLDYFGARYYASNMGRWMSPDWAAKTEPVPYAKLDNPQTLNLYSYVQNNPLSRWDDDGHETQTYYGNPSYAQQQWNDNHMSRTEMKMWGGALLTAAGGGAAAAFGRTALTALTSLCIMHCQR